MQIRHFGLDCFHNFTLQGYLRQCFFEKVVHLEEVKPLQVNTLVDGSLIYGREDEKRKIVEFVLPKISDGYSKTEEVSDDNHSRVICIVGEHGAGKSTLVNLVYNDQTVSDAFDTKVFLCMYEKFDEIRLLKEVLCELTGLYHDIPDQSILKDIMKEELMDKKILLVLKNANHQNQLFWNCVSELLNGSTKGSVALVTSENQIDAHGIKGKHFHHLNNLSNDDCWAIFKNHVFGGHDRIFNPEFKVIGELLLSKCNHNPLCIRVLGALLNFSVNKQWWLAILESQAWESHKFGVDTLPALRVCYDFMPNYLAKCFRYCSLFPKDYIFAKQYIVRLWMARGLLVSTGHMEGRELEDIGVQYFDELVQRSLFQHSPFVNAKEDQFVVHELLHCLAECVARNEYFRSEDKLCSIPENVSHLSLVSSITQTINLNPIKEKAGDLETCLVVTRSTLQPGGFLSPISNMEELSDLFLKFRSLRALDLSNTDMAELPDSIGALELMCFIALNNTKINHLPEELCTIVNLQTIEARGCRHLFELPKEMNKLKKLRHLDVSKESGHVLMPEKIGELINLQTLATFNIGSNSSYSAIGELKDLNSLMGHLEITGLDNIKDPDEAKEANLENKTKLETLSLEWSSGRQYAGNETDQVESAEKNLKNLKPDHVESSAEKVLKNLKPSKNLKELIIRYYTGSRFPMLWIEGISFPKLDSVILDSCFNCKTFPNLSKLPSLRYLSVRKMSGVQILGNYVNNNGTEKFPKFPSLELLNLWEMYDLEELFEINDGDVPKLRTISIYRCSVLNKIPSIPSLVELSFSSCTRVPENIEELPSLTLLKFENFRNTKHLNLPKKLPKLKQLELSYCNELSSVEGLPEITSAEKIVVVCCPKVDLLSNLKQSNFKRVNITRFREEYIASSASLAQAIRASIVRMTPASLSGSINVVSDKEGKVDEGDTSQKKRSHQKMDNAHDSHANLVSHSQSGADAAKPSPTFSDLCQLNQFSDITFEETKRSEEPVNDPNELQTIEMMLEEMLSQNKAFSTKHKGGNVVNYTEFTYTEIKEATNDFSETLKIGEGGFGYVYKAVLRGEVVAIKKSKLHMNEEPYTYQTNEQFTQEINVLANITHPNITKLIGVCSERGILVHELLPNGSLEGRLGKEESREPLLWKMRVRIALDICSALIYLHTVEPHGIVHGDLKPSNILFDSNDSCKLTGIVHGDLKPSNIFFHSNDSCKLTVFDDFDKLHLMDILTPSHVTVAGTVAYMDPDYLRTGHKTPATDIYSFGIMLLELVCGDAVIRKGHIIYHIIEVAENGFEAGKLDDVVDASANWPLDVAKRMVILGLSCFQPRWRRPQAKDVWIKLKSIEVSSSHEISDLPREYSF